MTFVIMLWDNLAGEKQLAKLHFILLDTVFMDRSNKWAQVLMKMDV